MSWLYYLLEANLYLLVFFVFYLLALRGETFYNRNRFYLIGSGILAFVVPFLQLGFLKPQAIIEQANYMIEPNDVPDFAAQAVIAPPDTALTFSDFILPIYLLIASLFLVKLGLGIIKIIAIYKKANKQKVGNAIVVELDDESIAFSFLNLLFIHPQLPKRDLIFTHELVHIEQKHSWDVLFFELLQIINWFNPIIYFIKKEIKVLHEYIADELATPHSNTKHEYAMVLIENSLQFKSHVLANQFFNQSILKRRLTMLNKEKTKSWAKLKLLLALPLVGGMLCLSTMAFTKSYGYDLLPQTANLQDTVKKVKRKSHDEKFPPPIVKDKPSFFPKRDYKKSSTNPNFLEDRYVLMNNQPIKDLEKVWGVLNATRVVYFWPKDAISKYGDKAKHGAVEITGGKIKYLKPGQVPPPPPVDQIKFPPPIIKKDRIKFPSPIVRKDNPKNSRVVWTSQQLVPINIRPNKINKDTVIYKEELKDCFQIIECDANGKSKIALDWTLCPSGKCPTTGTFLKGTKEYEKLGLLIAKSKTVNDIKFPPPIVKPDNNSTNNIDKSDYELLVNDGK